MRRWTAALVCASMPLLTGTACTTVPPAGTDGDVTNDWPRIGAPTPFTPAAGTCHEEIDDTGSIAAYLPVDCRELHVSETIHVGKFSGATDARPVDGNSAAGRAAYRDCSTRASSFVGAPWRRGQLALTVVRPSESGWQGGARWYRCELSQAEVTSSRPISRESSLAKALAAGASLRLGCFSPTVVRDQVDAMKPVPCAAEHRAEFVGVWQAPEMSYDELTADEVHTPKGCRSAIATFTAVPDDADVQYRSGWISYPPTEAEWAFGERGVRCFLWFDDRSVSRSLKGVGPSGLPIRYA